MEEWKTVKNELLKSPKTRREYKRLAPKYALISQLIAARLKKKLTQEELAFKVRTKQSAISRLEAGSANPTLGFLEKLAVALDSNLQVKFLPS